MLSLFAKALAAVLLLAASAPAVELHIRFAALERMLAEQAFTEEGRSYVRGNQKTRCNYAYLESPKVDAEAGRLRIRARFTGRTALNMFRQCVGVGDAFNVVIIATPHYRDGSLRLRDVKVASEGKDGFYIRRVCNAMASTLSRDFKYALAEAAKTTLEDPGNQPAYRREVRRFDVAAIRVTDDSLILVVDFELTVK